MYLAKNVGGWSTTRIGRFYNGRHHTTVLHAIGKIERFRKNDELVDALIEVLTAVLSPPMDSSASGSGQDGTLDRIGEGLRGAGIGNVVTNSATQACEQAAR
jgi:Bacterial dnaA protein helix-turn-helix